MKTTVFTLKPYFDIDGYFINIEGEPTFDPKHPITYPGNEVRLVEELTDEQFLNRYGIDGLDEVIYLQRGKLVQIIELTGKTSADIVLENR